ncbi:hypothetical protein BDV93DRAFT_502808 [Ceratobasidium sp. AG-I]|nr:hypothetical protein BDV93DRAFT_502808 [Ceratobasidium sp. AG-I]
MFSRLAAAAPTVAGRRSYSFFFSSKPPGGLKPSQTNVAKRTASSPSSPPSPGPSPSTSVSSSGSTSASTSASTSSSQTTQAAPTPAPELKALPAPPAPTPIPALHPAPVLATLHLHSFFSLDRPMLLLSQPTSRLFNAGPPPRAASEDAGETDADADAARQLSHTLVMTRVQGAAQWATAMQRLGITADAADVREEARVQEDLDVLMDSVQRKRRKKITKHKYKKRRKLQRSERRRLGK